MVDHEEPGTDGSKVATDGVSIPLSDAPYRTTPYWTSWMPW